MRWSARDRDGRICAEGPASIRRPALLWLLVLALLGACSLPLNTTVRDWSRLAGVAIAQPPRAGVSSPDAALAMRQALSTYFYAIGVLWEGADLPFDAADFNTFASRAEDPAASWAILDLSRLLRAASDEKPPRWLPRDNSGSTPAYEDRRVSTMVGASDNAVQTLLAILSGTAIPRDATPRGMAPQGDDAAMDPALRQVAREQEVRQARQAADRVAAGTQYAQLIAVIAEGHAVLAARANLLGQRSTELQLRLAEDALRRSMARGFASRSSAFVEARP